MEIRTIIFRGKRKDNGKWVYGVPYFKNNQCFIITDLFTCEEYQCTGAENVEVIPSTIGQYTGLKDKNDKRVFEGDIVQYNTYDDFDCQSIVRFGEYIQDGSGGEYKGTTCIGFYVEVDNFTCPDWYDDMPECFSDYQKQQNIFEVAKECEVIGNIHDNKLEDC